MTDTPKTVFVTRNALDGCIEELDVVRVWDSGVAMVKRAGHPDTLASV